MVMKKKMKTEESDASEMKLQREQGGHIQEKPTPEKEPIFNGGGAVNLCEI